MQSVVNDQATADAIAGTVNEFEETSSNAKKLAISWKSMESYSGTRKQSYKRCRCKQTDKWKSS